RALGRRDRLAVDLDAIARADIDRRRVENLAVEGDAAGGDHLLGVAARGDAGARQTAGDALVLRRCVRSRLLALPPAGARRVAVTLGEGALFSVLAAERLALAVARGPGLVETRLIGARSVKTRPLGLWPVSAGLVAVAWRKRLARALGALAL